MLAKCPVQFEYVYMKGMRRPPGSALVTGRGVDSAANQNLGSKMLTGELLELDVVSDIARDTVAAEIEKDGMVLEPDEADIGLKAAIGVAKDRAVRMARQHAIELAPVLDPLTIQRKYEVEIDCETGPIDFSGYSDVETKANVQRDLKSSRKSPPADAAENSMQLTAYATMKTITDGVPPASLSLDTIVTLKKETKIIQQPTTRSRDQMAQYLDRTRRAAGLIRSGNFNPTDPSNWWCSQHWCGFWDLCPHALRPVAVVVGGATVRAEPGQKE
jgi:hypothetical protein